MKTNLKFKQSVAGFLIFAMFHLCWLTSYGWAEMVATDTPSQTETSHPRQHLLDLLNREDVQNELEKYGLSQAEAAARINSLTDAEVATLVDKLDQLPNGGLAAVLGVLVYAAFYGSFFALYLALYVPRVLVRGLECLTSDCEAKGGLDYVFQPLEGPEMSYDDEVDLHKDKTEEDYTSSSEDGY